MVTVALILAVLVLALYRVRDHYRLRTLEKYAREWGAPVGARGACKKGPTKLRVVR